MDEAAEEKLQALYARADIYHRTGDYRKMLDLSREALAVQPDGAWGHIYAARAMVGLEQYAGAEKHLRQALAAEPELPLLHHHLALVSRLQKRFKPAEEHVKKALELDPEEPSYWCELSQICHDQEDLVGARRYAKKAMELDPENATALNLLGMSTRDDTPEGAREALQVYEKALETDPEDAYVFNNMGVAHLQLQDYARAEEFFRKALSMDPSEKIFRKNLYVVLRHRSLLYRALNLPGDLLAKAIGYVGDHWWTFFFILIIPAMLIRTTTKARWVGAWTLLLIPVAGFVVWFLVFKPLIKFYEFLIFADIKAQAREVGARRGGPFGVHGWPFWARFLLFFAVMCGAWTAIGLAAAHPATRPVVIGVVVAGVVVFILWGWVAQYLESRRQKKAGERRVRFLRMERKK